MRPRLCTPLTLTCLLTPLVPGSAFAQNWGEIAIISETLGVSGSRICIGEATRGDIGCPTYAPTVSPTGTLNVTSGMAANRISLTTTGTTWGYLASGASYIPNLSSNAISATAITVNTGVILGASRSVSGQAQKICSGKTEPGVGWIAYVTTSPTTIYTDINTSGCGFSSTPNYITSIGGSKDHWVATGGSSVYNATATGFRIYIRDSTNQNITPADAADRNWHIIWSAFGQ